MTKDPTNMAEEYMASYLFIHAVKRSKPIKAVIIASNAMVGRYHGKDPCLALRIVSESFKKFCSPVNDPPEAPQANRFINADVPNFIQ